MTDLEFLILVGAIVFLAIGVSIFFRTFLVVRQKFPGAFKDGLAASHLMDTYVWDPLVPSTVRRQYFLYLACIIVVGCLFACLALLRGEAIFAIIAGCITILAFAHGILRWLKYRDRM
jgi:hypothetical protein